jgi:hypothetical protein
MSGFIGSGDLYFDRLTPAGVRTGLFPIGNATEFAIKSDSDTKDRPSRQRTSYGQLLDSVSIAKPSTVTIKTDEVTKDTLAMALMGKVAALPSGTSSVTDEVVIAIKGKWVKLDKSNLNPTGIAVSNENASKTYQRGVDYEINERLGLFLALDGGEIANGEAVKLDCTTLATDGYRISGAAEPTVNAFLMLDGVNFNTGEQVIVTVDWAIFTPSTPVDFLAANFLDVGLSGRAKTLPGKTSPYTVDIIKAA